MLATIDSTPQSSSHRYPLSHYISYSNLSPSHKAFSLAVSTNIEPKSYGEAMIIIVGSKQSMLNSLPWRKTKPSP